MVKIKLFGKKRDEPVASDTVEEKQNFKKGITTDSIWFSKDGPSRPK